MVEPPMTVSTTVTSPTDAAFEPLAHRTRRTVRRSLVDSDGFPRVDRLVDPMSVHRHAGSRPDDLRKRFSRLEFPELKHPGVGATEAMADRVPFAGVELLEARPSGGS